MRDALIDLLGEAIGKENVITDNRQAQRVIDEVNGRVRPERISNKEVNKRFNEELQQQIDGTLPKDHTYQLGLAGSVLQSAGVRALPIELRASRLTDKSMQENHPFELSDIKNLPNAIQEPIMVFDSANTAGRKVILTEIESRGNNFVVVLSAELKGNKLEVNRIRSLYPKDSVQGIVDWINAGNLLKYADKNKALEWIGKQQSNSADVTNTIKNLDVAAKVLQNFENPTIIEQKNEKNLKEHRLVGGNSGYVGYSMSKRAEQAREEGRYPKTDFKKVYNISDKTLKALVSAGIIDDNEWHHASTPIHEYTHLWAEALRKVNPKEWQNIVSLMKKQTHLWDKVKNDYPELKTDDEIADEVLAHYSGERGKKLLDEEYNKIRDNNKMNIFDKAKMLQAINNVREALRKFWKGVADLFNIHFTSAEEVADKVLSDLLEGVNPNEVKSEEEKIIERAKADGTYMKAPNGKKSNLNEKQWVQVRTKAFKKWFGDWEKSFQKKFLLSDNVVDKLKGDEFKSDGVPLTEKVDKYYKEKYNGKVDRDDLGEVILDKRSVKDSIAHGIGKLKASAFAGVPEVIKKGLIIDKQENWKGRNYNSVTIAAPIEIGGENYVCVAIVIRGKATSKNSFYLHEVLLQKNLLNENFKTDTKADSHQGDVAKLLQNIVTTKESSKIVDENGEPMVVYHSGNSGITAFSRDFDKTGIGRQFWGKGFYFGTIKSKYEWARIYKEKKGKDATEYAVFLNLRNPKKGVLGDKDYSDFDGAILPPVNAVGGKTEPIYIAKKPNQIKSATDNVGTFDSEDADIRFHKSTERVVEKATDKALEEVKDPILKRAYKGILKESTKDKWASFADDYHALRVMEDKVIEEMRKRDPKFRLHHSVYEQQIAAKAATQGQIFLFSQQTFKPLLDKVDKIKYQ